MWKAAAAGAAMIVGVALSGRPRLAEAVTMTGGIDDARAPAGAGPTAGPATKRRRQAPPQRRRRRAVGEVAMVDDAEFTSYYGRPIIKTPVWKIAGRAALPVPRRSGGDVVDPGARWPTSPAGRR